MRAAKSSWIPKTDRQLGPFLTSVSPSFSCLHSHHRHSLHRRGSACPPSGPQRSRALLSELFQAQRVPASTTIEFCFHYAGFLWSSKLIWILSSLLRPLYKGLCFCLPWRGEGLSHFPRMAFLLARTAWPSSLCQGSEFPDLQAVGGCPPGLWGSMPRPPALFQHPPVSNGPLAFKIHTTVCIIICIIVCLRFC